MKKIVYTKNGTLFVVHPVPFSAMAPHDPLLAFEGDEESFLQFILEKDVPDGAENVSVVDSVPEDRYFRDAWVIESGGVSIDMDKARGVHMDNIRIARDEKLKELDVLTLRGVDVQEEKQVLRDIPQTFDLSCANNEEELKALWPSDLEK